MPVAELANWNGWGLLAYWLRGLAQLGPSSPSGLCLLPEAQAVAKHNGRALERVALVRIVAHLRGGRRRLRDGQQVAQQVCCCCCFRWLASELGDRACLAIARSRRPRFGFVFRAPRVEPHAHTGPLSESKQRFLERARLDVGSKLCRLSLSFSWAERVPLSLGLLECVLFLKQPPTFSKRASSPISRQSGQSEKSLSRLLSAWLAEFPASLHENATRSRVPVQSKLKATSSILEEAGVRCVPLLPLVGFQSELDRNTFSACVLN